VVTLIFLILSKNPSPSLVDDAVDIISGIELSLDCKREVVKSFELFIIIKIYILFLL
jgi:hypothetical protein